MSWMRFLFRDFQSAIELNQLEDDRRRTGRERRKRLRKQQQQQQATQEHVEELEREIAQVRLLARTLADVCIQKGLMTAEELTRHAMALAPQVEEADAGGEDAVG